MNQEFLMALLVAVAGGIGTAARAFIKTYLTPQRLNTLLGMTRAVIAAADEVGNVLTLPSSQKYEYAESALAALAKRLGLRLKPEELNALIHAVLYEEHLAEAAALRSLDFDGADEVAPAAA